MKKILIISLLFCSLITNATIKYVAASGGNNGNAGTFGSPWATLAYAVTQVTSGDTIYMQAGTHTINTNVVLPIGISLMGAGETSIITSISLTSEWGEIISLESANLANGNQSISYLKFDGVNQTIAQALWIAKRNNVKIHHCTFINFKYIAVYWCGDGGYAGGDPYTGAYPPTNYVTGSEFYNNTVTDCSVYDSYGRGALYIGGHSGMLIHDNVMNELTRPTGQNGYPIKIMANGGWMKGLKCYNNILTTEGNPWLFSIEAFFVMGGEFYNNTVQGAIDINFSWRGDANEYDYGTWIHNNTIGPATDPGGSIYFEGVIYEFRVEDNIIEKNYFRNNAVGIHHTMRTPAPWVYNENIRYNFFYNSGRGTYHSVLRFGETNYNFILDSINVFNNVFHSETSGGIYFGIHMRGFQTAKKIRVINNIFQGMSYRWFESNRGDYFDFLYTQNNIVYNAGTLNLGGTPTNYTNSGNLTSNPLFTNAANGDFTIPTNSPAKDAGLDLGLTSDYRNYTVPFNTIPDIGAYEFGSTAAVPVTSIAVTGAGGATTISVNGGTLQMSAAILPVDASIQTVTWSKTDETGTGTISASGLVTATTDGTITVTATAQDGSGTHGHLQLTFSNQSAIPVSSITVWGAGGASTISTDGGTLQMLKKTLPTNATDTTVIWSVTNNTGAGTISAAGILTAVANGTVTVKATANDGSAVFGDSVITISNQLSLPTVTIGSILSYNSMRATISAEVTGDGGGTITARGLVYSTIINPILANSSYTIKGGTTGVFYTHLNELHGNTTYYVRAYATNSKGTTYSSNIVMITPTFTWGLYNGKVYKVGNQYGVIK